MSRRVAPGGPRKERRGLSRLFVVVVVAAMLALVGGPRASGHPEGPAHHNPLPVHATDVMRAFVADSQSASTTNALGYAACANGFAGPFPCSNVDLLSYLPLDQIGGSNANDIWGWTDPFDKKEYALVGRVFGTSFVDISEPTAPVYLGELPTHGAFGSSWRDIKVYADHAFIVSEARGHGMQVFDLTQLRNVSTSPVTFSETAHYNQMSTAHNIAINEDSGFAYIVGAGGKNGCNGGLHMVNIQNPTSPSFAGCFSADGYTHDTQCVIYDKGPDTDHRNKEICFNSNEDTLTIVDVTNKSAPVQLSRTGYSGSGYTHQGWLTEDHRYFLLDDEKDEQNYGHNTRTRVWDVADLDNPTVMQAFDGTTRAIDHNQYVKGGFSYQANYRAGLRIIDARDPAATPLKEVGFFDIYPADDNANFNGAWSTYPFFPSGVVVVSGIEQGLFVLQPKVAAGGPGVTITNPSNGSSVSGTVTVTAEASDDSGISSVEFLVGEIIIATDTSGNDGWSAQWDTTAASDGGYTLTAAATSEAGEIASDSIVVTVHNDPDPTMHVGDLDGAATTINGGRWTATVIITVHDTDHNPIGGVTVTGSWSAGTSMGSCVTDAGSCSVTSSILTKKTSSASFTVSDLTKDGFVYGLSDNHDGDDPPDSDGTTIVVTKT